MKILFIGFLVLFVSACGNNSCEKLREDFSIIYAQQVIVDLENNRDGFRNKLLQVSDKFEDPDPKNIYEFLSSKTMTPINKAKYLEEFGGLFLHIAIIHNDRQVVQFYLENNVDPLKYYKYIGIPITTLVDKQDDELFRVFYRYYQNKNMREKIYLDVVNYFHSCHQTTNLSQNH